MGLGKRWERVEVASRWAVGHVGVWVNGKTGIVLKRKG